MCKHFDLKVLEAGGLEWISMKPVGHLVLFLDKFFASVVATLFVCVNNFYLGAVVSVVCPPMLRLLSAAPCPHHRVPAKLPARRKRPIETHRCDSSVLCCLNSITQQIMMIMIEVLVPNNPGHVFIGLSSSPLGWKIFQPFKKNNNKNFLRDKQKNYLCLGLLLGNWSFIIHVVNKSMYI